MTSGAIGSDMLLIWWRQEAKRRYRRHMTQRFFTYTHFVKLINRHLRFGLLNTSSLTENQFQLLPENKKMPPDKELVFKMKIFIHGHHRRIHIIYSNKSKCLTIWKMCYDSHIQRKCASTIKYMTTTFQTRGNYYI